MSGTLRIDWVRLGRDRIHVSSREPWSPAHTARFTELQATDLTLTGTGPWGGPGDERTCRFLRDLPTLRRLQICPSTGDGDWTVVGDLHQLQQVRIDVPDLDPVPDLSALTRLDSLTLHWTPGADRMLASAPPLRELGLVSWGLPDATALQRHTGALQRLHLTAARRVTHLDELASATHLESLRLTYCTRLTTLQPLAHLENLQRLTVERCGTLTDFSVLSTLTGLRAVELDNTVTQSLQPLRGLPQLECVSIDGHVADGDLSPLLTLPSLRFFWFTDRRHYSHRRVDLHHALGLNPDAYLPNDIKTADQLN